MSEITSKPSSQTSVSLHSARQVFSYLYQKGSYQTDYHSLFSSDLLMSEFAGNARYLDFHEKDFQSYLKKNQNKILTNRFLKLKIEASKDMTNRYIFYSSLQKQALI